MGINADNTLKLSCRFIRSLRTWIHSLQISIQRIERHSPLVDICFTSTLGKAPFHLGVAVKVSCTSFVGFSKEFQIITPVTLVVV